MNPYERCFDELGIATPTVEQKRALRRLVITQTPERSVVERATLEAAEQRKRCREDDARVDVLRDAAERVVAMDSCPAPIRRKLEKALGATTYDGRTEQEIVRAAGKVT